MADEKMNGKADHYQAASGSANYSRPSRSRRH